jgi:hypothetical protein
MSQRLLNLGIELCGKVAYIFVLVVELEQAYKTRCGDHKQPVGKGTGSYIFNIYSNSIFGLQIRPESLGIRVGKLKTILFGRTILSLSQYQ